MKLRRKIDFFIVGAPKSGTSSLYRFLGQHDDIFLPDGKDFFAFLDDPLYGVPESKLGAYYHEYNGEPLVGGSNIHIMRFPSAVKSLHNYNPDARLIVMLRDPVGRAYSAYWMMRRMGRERCGTFEAALAQDSIRARSGKFRHNTDLRYLEPGYYCDQIKFIFQYFDRERVYIGLLDDLKQDPEQVTCQVLNRLGADTSNLRIDFSEKTNEAREPRFMGLQRIITSQNRLKRIYRKLAPLSLRIKANEVLFSRLLEKNLKPAKYPPMAPETRAELADHFQSHNEKLSDLLGRDLSHWQ
jgi:hypothetical protein